MLYRILKILIGLGMRLYYREIRVKNAFNLEHKGPMIIIANHPNTLMDAWLIALSSKQPIYYLAKGTYFNTKFKRWILGSLGMIPINRTQDGNTSGVNNTDSFEACYKVLEAGKILVIFPEGNSVMERQLRELKSGTARIALEALNRNDGKLDLKIVPVGLFYSQGDRFRSSVFVNFGEGVVVNEFLELYRENSIQASRDLTLKFRNMLEGVLVLSASKEQETLVDTICEILHSDTNKKNVETKAKFMADLHKRLEEIQLVEPEKMVEIQQMVNELNWQSEQMEIRTEFLEKGFRSKRFFYELMLSLFILLIGLPIFVFGFIHSILPFKITDLLMPRLVKNVEYYAPIAILLGLVFYPINYILLMNLADHLFGFNLIIKILYFFLMPITGMYAFHFARFFGAFSFRLRFIFLLLNRKDALDALNEKKGMLQQMVESN
jgi:1-acyl-sn-glycerol-3-phosphate acyltransferase